MRRQLLFYAIDIYNTISYFNCISCYTYTTFDIIICFVNRMYYNRIIFRIIRNII